MKLSEEDLKYIKDNLVCLDDNIAYHKSIAFTGKDGNMFQVCIKKTYQKSEGFLQRLFRVKEEVHYKVTLGERYSCNTLTIDNVEDVLALHNEIYKERSERYQQEKEVEKEESMKSLVKSAFGG